MSQTDEVVYRLTPSCARSSMTGLGGFPDPLALENIAIPEQDRVGQALCLATPTPRWRWVAPRLNGFRAPRASTLPPRKVVRSRRAMTFLASVPRFAMLSRVWSRRSVPARRSKVDVARLDRKSKGASEMACLPVGRGLLRPYSGVHVGFLPRLCRVKNSLCFAPSVRPSPNHSLPPMSRVVIWLIAPDLRVLATAKTPSVHPDLTQIRRSVRGAVYDGTGSVDLFDSLRAALARMGLPRPVEALGIATPSMAALPSDETV